MDKTLQDGSLFLQKRTTIASYPGGKSDKKKHSSLFLAVPKRVKYLVEPFAGLANFFLVISPRVEKVWLNEKDPEVYALLSCVHDSDLLEKLIKFVQSIEPVEREDYYNWKKLQPTEIMEQAVRRLVILNCSVNGAGGGYSNAKAHRKWYKNKPKIWKAINKILCSKDVKITNYDYLDVLNSLGKDGNPLIYLDPPYYEVARQGNLYGKNFNQIDWLQLKNTLIGQNQHWILSNRDCEEMRTLFKQFYLHQYNTYNDMNNTRNKNPELIVSNKSLNLKQKTNLNQKTLESWL